jgi:hypothetical protein
MERRPRKPEQPILNRGDTWWFVVAGVVMGAATLGVPPARRTPKAKASRARWG